MNRRRILLVEPTPMVLELLSVVLEEAGFAIVRASGIEEALGMALVEPPDLVITEMRLDRLDGAVLCQRLKTQSRTAAVKVIILSTSPSDSDMRRAARAGAASYMCKPFSPIALIERVSKLLDSGASGCGEGAAEN